MEDIEDLPRIYLDLEKPVKSVPCETFWQDGSKLLAQVCPLWGEECGNFDGRRLIELPETEKRNVKMEVPSSGVPSRHPKVREG